MNFRPGLSRLMRWILLLSILFVLLLLLLMAALYLWFPRPANGAISSWPAFNLGFHYDIRWVSLVALVVLVLGSIPILNPFRKNTARIIWMTVFMVLAFALIIFYVFDFGYYAYLSQRLNASALNFLKDAKISGAMIWQTYPVLRILLGILVFLALIGWFLRWSYRMISNFPDPSTRTSRIVGFIVGFLLFGVAIFGHLGQYPLRWSDAFGLGNDYAANLALNPMESFFNTMDFRNTGFDAEAARKYQLMMSGYLGINVSGDSISYFRTRNPKPVVTSKPNIVLVICESFSAYKSSMWGNKLNTTPFFNQLCENGMFFDRCFTPSFGTARGVWATLTGIPDVQLPKRLAEILRSWISISSSTTSKVTIRIIFLVEVPAGQISGDYFPITFMTSGFMNRMILTRRKLMFGESVIKTFSWKPTRSSQKNQIPFLQ